LPRGDTLLADECKKRTPRDPAKYGRASAVGWAGNLSSFNHHPALSSSGPGKYDVTLSYVCKPLQRIMNMLIELSSPPVRFEVSPGEPGPVYSDGG